jgi:alanine racemase
MCAILVAALGYQPLRHILNSSGISRFTTEFQLDMVRLGIGLYGVDAILQPNLQTVFTLKATISQLKTVPAGETVGYNRMGKTKAETRVATVTIGYADGLSRRLSNGKGGMYLHGKLAPIIGNVCMDMCMLNVTHIPQAAVGDEVIIFGEKNPVQDLAKLLETIPYEIFTNVSNRVKRVYFQD